MFFAKKREMFYNRFMTKFNQIPSQETPHTLPKSPYWDMKIPEANKWISTRVKKRTKALLESDEEDQFKSYYPILHTPFSSYSNIMVHDANESNPYHAVYRYFPRFTRLRSLQQYGTSMQHIGGYWESVSLHNHNRECHTLDVALHAEIIWRTLWLTEAEINTLIFAGLWHDYATPAMGDIAKQFFWIESEETIFEKYLRAQMKMKYWDNFEKELKKLEIELSQKYNVKFGDLDKVIRGEWFLWQVLDLADRLSYTLRDVKNFYPEWVKFNTTNHPMDNLWIHWQTDWENIQILDNNKYLWDIFLCVKREWDNVVFTDARKLLCLLKLRANMHQLIYLNSNNWANEYLYGLIIAFLIENNKLTYEDILYWEVTEWDIDKKLTSMWLKWDISNLTTEKIFTTHSFRTEEEAQEEINKRKSQNEIVFVKKVPGFSSGGKYLVQWSDKKTRSISEEYPHIDEAMKITSSQTSCYAVYGLSDFWKTRLSKISGFIEFLKSKSL